MTDRGGPSVRAATLTDVPALAAIMAANDEPMDWPELPDVPGWPYLEHLVHRARVCVAELARTIVGFAGSVEVGRPDVLFLTDLYVHPTAHGRGSGRSLLDEALEGATERMTFSSSDERALGLYIRAGMRPWWPLLYMEIAAGVLGDLDHGTEILPADVAETVRLSNAWTGVDRTIDFGHYASLPESTGFVVRDHGTVAAVGWARRERKRSDGRWLDHASFAPNADPIRTGMCVLRAAAGGDAAARADAAAGVAARADATAGLAVTAAIPGPHPVVAALIERGARIGGLDQFCATDPGLVDPLHLFPHPGFL